MHKGGAKDQSEEGTPFVGEPPVVEGGVTMVKEDPPYNLVYNILGKLSFPSINQYNCWGCTRCGAVMFEHKRACFICDQPRQSESGVAVVKPVEKWEEKQREYYKHDKLPMRQVRPPALPRATAPPAKLLELTAQRDAIRNEGNVVNTFYVNVERSSGFSSETLSILSNGNIILSGQGDPETILQEGMTIRDPKSARRRRNHCIRIEGVVNGKGGDKRKFIIDPISTDNKSTIETAIEATSGFFSKIQSEIDVIESAEQVRKAGQALVEARRYDFTRDRDDPEFLTPAHNSREAVERAGALLMGRGERARKLTLTLRDTGCLSKYLIYTPYGNINMAMYRRSESVGIELFDVDLAVIFADDHYRGYKLMKIVKGTSSEYRVVPIDKSMQVSPEQVVFNIDATLLVLERVRPGQGAVGEEPEPLFKKLEDYQVEYNTTLKEMASFHSENEFRELQDTYRKGIAELMDACDNMNPQMRLILETPRGWIQYADFMPYDKDIPIEGIYTKVLPPKSRFTCKEACDIIASGKKQTLDPGTIIEVDRVPEHNATLTALISSIVPGNKVDVPALRIENATFVALTPQLPSAAHPVSLTGWASLATTLPSTNPIRVSYVEPGIEGFAMQNHDQTQTLTIGLYPPSSGNNDGGNNDGYVTLVISANTGGNPYESYRIIHQYQGPSIILTPGILALILTGEPLSSKSKADEKINIHMKKSEDEHVHLRIRTENIIDSEVTHKVGEMSDLARKRIATAQDLKRKRMAHNRHLNTESPPQCDCFHGPVPNCRAANTGYCISE